MKKTEMKIIKNIFFWANELILPIPQEILETELLNYVRTFKVTAQLAAEISSSFYEYLILANTSAINRTLKNEIEILIFQAEHMIFQTDPGNISSIFEIIENLYVKGVQKLLNYLDAYIPIDHTARSHINLSNHLKH